MTIPDFQSLMLPILEMASHGEEFRTGDVVDEMARKHDLTEQEREQLLPSGRQTLIANRTHWAITYLAKTGLLERTRRGYVRITDRGRSVMSASHHVSTFSTWLASPNSTRSGHRAVH